MSTDADGRDGQPAEQVPTQKAPNIDTSATYPLLNIFVTSTRMKTAGTNVLRVSNSGIFKVLLPAPALPDELPVSLVNDGVESGCGVPEISRSLQ